VVPDVRWPDPPDWRWPPEPPDFRFGFTVVGRMTSADASL
jgi:hypothetical protein